ncbi:hypothetical protein BDW74DRAFT_151918 [Aspergillus multicolor]|uniref:uncharacterized protein n=1 Tax=Aspergillus multicolor TaxID=41759 RepID=UPI003CCE3BB5
MRHFDAWILRDPYSIFHYYSTGHRWKETVRDLIQARKICAPLSLSNGPSTSSPPVDPYSEEHLMSPQSTSALITKLPLEVRLLIYEYAFGDQVVHLVQVKDKIRHVRCTNTTSSLDKNRRCCPVTPARWRANDLAAASSTALGTGNNASAFTSMLYPHTHPLLPSNLSNSSAALLRTCRFIYAEASSTLYKNSIFDVDDLTTFIAFSLSISPDHLRAIKKLTIQWTPVWQPMAGEEHKSSIYSHTHNDRLWVLFWTRVAALSGLEELALSVDMGSFAAPGANTPPGAGGGNEGGLIGGNRLRLSIDEPWVAPLLCVRGIRSFELGITAKCDAAAKQFLEVDLVRDAVMLRDHLRLAMCTERGAGLPVLPGLQGLDLSVQLQLLNRCAVGMNEVEADHRGVRLRLAITAA